MDRFVNMIIRRAAYRFVGKGVDAGAEYLSARRSPDGKAADITKDQRARARRTSRNARQALRVARRLGRF